MSLWKKIINYLNQPEETDFAFRDSLAFGIGISLAVSFIVYFFFVRPAVLNSWNQFFISFMFGLITFIVSMSNDQLWPRLFPHSFAEKNWNVGKNLLYIAFNILAIALANSLYMRYIGFMRLSWTNMAYMLLNTFLVGIVPLSIFGLIRHNQRLKARLQEANLLNQQLLQAETTPSLPTQVQLSFNNKLSILSIEQFLFAVSEGNYLKITQGNNKEIQIRGTIKSLESQLEEFPRIIRCHRAYMVNLNQVESLTGNAQGYRLKIKSLETEVPVSRSYVPKVKQLLLE